MPTFDFFSLNIAPSLMYDISLDSSRQDKSNDVLSKSHAHCCQRIFEKNAKISLKIHKIGGKMVFTAV